MLDWSHLDSVERSAVMTLSWRAAESKRKDRLFEDSAAEEAAAQLPPWPCSVESGLFADIVALRTLQMDEETADALRGPEENLGGRLQSGSTPISSRPLTAGIDQIVLLGAGLDTRFWRVPLPSETRVIAVDSAAVNALAGALLPSGGRVERFDARIPGGLAQALRRASFDSDRSTLWIAEGLLEYLPGRSWERLMAELSRFSAPGSRALVTILGNSLPALFAHDPTFPFPRLPAVAQIIAEVPQDWHVEVVAARRRRQIPPGAFAIMVMERLRRLPGTAPPRESPPAG